MYRLVVGRSRVRAPLGPDETRAISVVEKPNALSCHVPTPGCRAAPRSYARQVPLESARCRRPEKISILMMPVDNQADHRVIAQAEQKA